MPRLTTYGSMEFGIPEYALRYSYSQNGFVLKNLSNRPRQYKVDLSALGFAATHYQLSSKSLSGVVGARTKLTLSAQEEARWTPGRLGGVTEVDSHPSAMGDWSFAANRF